MKALVAATALLTATAATSAEVIHHQKSVKVKTPYTETVCQKKDPLRGGVEGAVIGGLLGEAFGGGDTTKGLALFGAIVGANESQYQVVCHEETRYKYKWETLYTHSTVTFTDNGKTYTVDFQR